MKIFTCLIVQLILLLGFSTQSLANQDKDCAALIGKILGSKKAPERAYKRKAKNLKRLSAQETLSEKEAQPLIDHIERVKDKVVAQSKTLTTPENLELNLSASDFSPYYNLIDESLHSTFKLVRQDPFLDEFQLRMHAQLGLPVKLYQKHPKYGFAITAHEYGHGILHASLMKDYPQLAEFIGVMRNDVMPRMKVFEALNEEMTEKMFKVFEMEEPFMDGIPPIVPDLLNGGYSMNPAYLAMRENNEALQKFAESTPEYQKLVVKVMELEEELQYINMEVESIIGKVQESGNPFVETANKISNYHELFADLIAVVSEDNYNPSIVADAIFTTREIQKHGEDVKVIAGHRDFATRRNDIDKWEETTQVHGFFGPVRKHLHDNYLKMPKYQEGEDMGKLLDAVYAAIKEHIDVLNSTPEALETLSPREINKLLMESIDRHMM